MNELEQIKKELALERAARILAEGKLEALTSKITNAYLKNNGAEESLFKKTAFDERDVLNIAMIPLQNPGPIVKLTRAGDVLFQNPAASRLTQFLLDGATYTSAELWRFIAEKLEAGANQLELQVYSGDQYYILTCIPVQSKDFINIYGRNATAKVLALQRLSERESLFFDIVENIPGIVFQWKQLLGQSGQLNFVSSKLYSVFGLQPEQLLRIWEYIHPDDLHKWNPTILYNEGQTTWNFEGRLLNPAGEEKWILCAAMKSSTSKDEVVYNGLMLDIDAQKKAEEALLKAHERWRFALEGSGDGMWEYNVLTGECIFSEVYKKNLGYTEEEFPNHISEWQKRIHPDDRDLIFNSDASYANATQHTHQNQYRMLCKDGTYKWVMDRGMLMGRSPDGKPSHFIGVHTDIDHLKKTEAALSSTAQRLSTLITNLKDGIILLDAAGDLLVANQSFCELFDLPVQPSQLLGKNISDLVMLQAKLFKDPTQLLETKTIIFAEKQPVTAQTLELGNGKILSGDYVPLFVDGAFDGHLCKFTDITDAKISERKLRRAEAKYRGIIENMNLGLVECDLEQRIIYANQSFCDMCGYSLEELENKRAEEVYYVSGNKLMDEKLALRQLGISDTYEISIEAKDGSQKHWLVSGAPRYNDHGELVGSIGIHLDITSRKQLEKELILAKRQVERASGVKDLFLVNVSHEIRTPLNAVIGMSKQLMRTQLDTDQQKYVDVIGTAAGNLLIIINDILDFSKMEAGELKLELKTFRLQEVIDNVSSVMALKAEEKGLSMKLSVDPSISPVLIGDAFHLNQVILNLFGNAIKFTDKGGVELHLIGKGIANKKQKLAIEIKDTGIGMDESFLEEIFEKFSTENASTTHVKSGAGLGVSISKELVELMGGQLEVRSKKEVGTEIHIYLSFDIGKQEDLAETRESEEDISILKGRKILVVEDNELNQMVAETILGHHGMQVFLAGNGQEALDKLPGGNFDLVLMDMKMPVMDGLEATVKLRELNYTIPVIALTANALKGEQEKCYEAGMNDFVTKPFEEKLLLDKVARWIAKKPAASIKENKEEEDQKLYSLQTLMDISRGQTEFVKAMVGIFITDAASTVEGIQAALTDNNSKRIYELAHRIKPSISNFCIPFVDEIKRIEVLANSAENNGELAQLVDRFASMMTKVIDGLSNWMEKN